jgi:hypothetical protein
MKRTIITAALLLGTVLGANADTAIQTYRDQIRPHGHARSEAVYQAALDVCSRQTGGMRTYHDTPAFQNCMSEHGYRWKSLRVERDAASRQPAVRERTWIDPETGDRCQAILGGFGSMCGNF